MTATVCLVGILGSRTILYRPLYESRIYCRRRAISPGRDADDFGAAGEGTVPSAGTACSPLFLSALFRRRRLISACLSLSGYAMNKTMLCACLPDTAQATLYLS